MTVLRQRMTEDMQLRGLAPRTQEAYVSAVEQRARHYRKSPDEIDEEELRQYLLHLQNVKAVSAGTMTVALCGIKFLYQHTLQREWHLLDLARAAHEKTLPPVLSVEEVARVLGCVHHPRYRACSTTMPGAELRCPVYGKPMQLVRTLRPEPLSTLSETCLNRSHYLLPGAGVWERHLCLILPAAIGREHAP
jgi:hypothetical protein